MRHLVFGLFLAVQVLFGVVLVTVLGCSPYCAAGYLSMWVGSVAGKYFGIHVSGMRRDDSPLVQVPSERSGGCRGAGLP